MTRRGRLKQEATYCKCCGQEWPAVAFYDQWDHPNRSQSWCIECQKLTDRVAVAWKGHQHSSRSATPPMSTVHPSSWPESFITNLKDLKTRREVGEALGHGGTYMRANLITQILETGAPYHDALR